MTSPSIKTQVLSVFLSPCLLVSFLVSVPASVRGQPAKRTPAKITFDPPCPTVAVGKSVSIRAVVSDKAGVEIPNAKVVWSIPQGANEFIEVANPLNNTATNRIVIVGKSKDPNSKSIVPDDIEIGAKAGTIEARLIVHYQAPQMSAPAKISFFHLSPDTPLASEIILNPGKKTKITATANQGATALNGDAIKWEVADQYKPFIDIGVPSVSGNRSTVAVGAFFGDEKLVPPSTVPIIARTANGFGVVLVNYRLAGPTLNTIKPKSDDKELSVAPGNDLALEVQVFDEKDKELAAPQVEWQALGTGGKFVRLTPDPADSRKVTVTGLFGPPNERTIPYSISIVAKSGTASHVFDVSYRGAVEPVVDVQWDVLPQEIVGDNFGRTIKKHYYCLEVVIGNNGGGDLQISGLGFELKVKDELGNDTYAIVPVSSYATVRGSHSRRKLKHPRALTLATINAFGQLLGGFNPFFINAAHGKNYGQFVNIISNPLAKGVELVWQDAYPGEVERLDQQALRDDKIISNNTTFKTRVFFPKSAIFDDGDPSRDVIPEVRKKLGRMIMVGTVIERKGFINRLRFGASSSVSQ